MPQNMVLNIAAPLVLRDSTLFEIWKKNIYIWQCFTTVKPEKQVLHIFWLLEGEARTAIVEMNLEELTKVNVADKVPKELNKLYLEYKLQLIYKVYDAYEKFKRPQDRSITEYVAEFE